MPQGTTAAALIRLRPIENNNIGSIVEEHVRYWKKTRDAEEAEEMARQARANEFNRKSQKESFELYNGLAPEENAGFLNDQIVTNFEKNKPYYKALSIEASKGNLDARLALADEKRKIESAVKINKIYSAKIQELEKQKADGTFNDVLDADTDRFKESLMSGKYKLNADWTFDVYSPALESEIKDKSSGLTKDGLIKLNSSTMFNNDFLNSQYNKKADFVKNGKSIAQNLLDKVNGNERITDATRIDGIRLVKGLLAQDAIESRTWIGTARSRGLIKADTPTGNLSEVEQNLIAEAYYNEFVEPNIQETDNSLANASKREDIATKARNRRNAQKEEDLQFSRATNEKGQDVAPDLSKDDADLFNSTLENGGRAFTINNGEYQVGGVSSNITQEVVGGSIDNDNQLTLLVKRTVEVPIIEKPKLVPNKFFDVETGNGVESLTLKERKGDDLIFFAENDKDSNETITVSIDNVQDIDTGKKRKEVQTRLVTDDAEINAISSDIGLGNTSTLFTEANKVLGDRPQQNSDKGILD